MNPRSAIVALVLLATLLLPGCLTYLTLLGLKDAFGPPIILSVDCPVEVEVGQPTTISASITTGDEFMWSIEGAGEITNEEGVSIDVTPSGLGEVTVTLEVIIDGDVVDASSCSFTAIESAEDEEES